MKVQERIADYAVLTQATEPRPLGEVVKPTRPRVNPSEKPHLPFIGMEHVEARTMRLLGTVPASTMKSSAVHFQPGDVLYGRLRPYLNKVYRPDFEGLCSAEFIVFPKTESLDGRYLQYFLNSAEFVSFATHLNAGDRPRVDYDQLAPYPFPVRPLDQQKHIVAEIEKQFSRLDEAVANLKRVKANLKRYKSAVLKAAVAGVERAWPESQLADVCQIVSGFAFKSVDFCASGIPAIKIANVGYGEFLWKDQEYLPLSFHSKYQSFVVRPGDLLLALTRPITNGTVKVCRYPNDAPVALLNQRVAVLRPTEKAKPEFLLSLLQSEIFKAQLNDALSETLQPNLSPVDLKKFSVRLPGVHEQMHIIDEIDRRLSVIRETESQVGSNHQRAERLRQSILSRAFNTASASSSIANTLL